MAMVRFAVIGLGDIARTAVLPAFAHVENAQLAALVSRSPAKLKQLGRQYRVPHLYPMREIDNCLLGGGIDAVYIALPNDLHCEYTILAANAYKHVLCEKPLAVTVEQGETMAATVRRRHVKFMPAYRLHHEPATQDSLKRVRSGQLGDLRSFTSTFAFVLRDPNNIRASAVRGGGALNDIGIYCLNAARLLFGAEPVEVYATMPKPVSRIYKDVDETVAVVLKFPEGRVATFTASFGLDDACWLEVQGTKGHLVLDPAYVYTSGLHQEVTFQGRTTRKTFPKTDQFAGEIRYFAECIEKDREPKPGIAEGLADLRVMAAIRKSAKLNRAIRL